MCENLYLSENLLLTGLMHCSRMKRIINDLCWNYCIFSHWIRNTFEMIKICLDPLFHWSEFLARNSCLENETSLAKKKFQRIKKSANKSWKIAFFLETNKKMKFWRELLIALKIGLSIWNVVVGLRFLWHIFIE